MDARAALWTFIGVFVVFKLATTAMIIVAHPAGVGPTLALFLALHWPFMAAGLVVGLGILFMAVVFRLRLLRVRARRAALEEAEWRVDSRV